MALNKVSYRMARTNSSGDNKVAPRTLETDPMAATRFTDRFLRTRSGDGWISSASAATAAFLDIGRLSKQSVGSTSRTVQKLATSVGLEGKYTLLVCVFKDGANEVAFLYVSSDSSQ